MKTADPFNRIKTLFFLEVMMFGTIAEMAPRHQCAAYYDFFGRMMRKFNESTKTSK